MTHSIKLTDFTFQLSGHGHYRITYTSPVTFKRFTKITSNMPLIDATKNAEEPKKTDLIELRRECKS